MKWLLLAAAAALAVAVIVWRQSNGAGQAENASVSHADPAVPVSTPAKAPLLESSGSVAGAQGTHATPTERKESEASPPRAPTTLPGGRKLRPGESFTPLSKLKPKSSEEREREANATRVKLEGLTPLRTTWTEAPLQDVLKALSAETGLTLALGPNALQRGAEIRVSAPLADDDPATAPTVWRLLEALAKKHGFELRPWKGGVLLREPRNPNEMRVMIHTVADLLRAKWAKGKGADDEDRLIAVLPGMLGEVVELGEGSSIRVMGSNLVIRAPAGVHDRLAAALTTWREEPKTLEKAWKTYVGKRHPTVSGAPPREDPPKRADVPGK